MHALRLLACIGVVGAYDILAGAIEPTAIPLVGVRRSVHPVWACLPLHCFNDLLNSKTALTLGLGLRPYVILLLLVLLRRLPLGLERLLGQVLLAADWLGVVRLGRVRTSILHLDVSHHVGVIDIVRGARWLD